MKGYKYGSFTLEIEEVFDEEVINSITFAAVPTSDKTVVKLSIPAGGGVSETSSLFVDADGDGASDIILEPVIDGVSIPDLLPGPVSVTTEVNLTGVQGNNDWYTSDVQIGFSTTNTENNLTETFYSVNDSDEWMAFSSLLPVTLSEEGSNTLKYYSVDSVGNRDATSTLEIKIDKTAPQAIISIDVETKDLLVLGNDNLSEIAIAKNGDNYDITDKAGHTTKLLFKNTVSKSNLLYSNLEGVQYDDGQVISLSKTSLLYVWDRKSPESLRSQTILSKDSFILNASFNKKKNDTTIFLKEKNNRPAHQKVSGLPVIKIIVDDGVIGYKLIN